MRDFTLTYLGPEGTEHHADLADAASLAFERAPPVRSFPSYRGQRNYPGLWWAATMGHHVGFESWLERDTALMLDLDQRVVAFASQPFWLHWIREGRRRSHAPDWFARLEDGTGLVLDCRPADKVRPKDAAAFEATARACAETGWQYELVCGHDPVVLVNARWLSGYRHPRYHLQPTAGAMLAAFAQPRALLAGVRQVGDPIGTLPVLFHLLWRGRLRTDLTVLLGDRSLIQPPRTR